MLAPKYAEGKGEKGGVGGGVGEGEVLAHSEGNPF